MRLDAATGWIRPDWPAPSPVQACFTTRRGGCSGPPYDALNLGSHVGDDPVRVQANRAEFASGMPAQPVFLDQVHGTQVIHLRSASTQGQSADASMTHHVGLACTVLVADCLPVLLTTADGRCVAAAHAGWRGLAAGVLSHTVASLRQLHQQQVTGLAPTELLAWLGPCIGPASFEVGAEVCAAFQSLGPRARAAFKPHTAGKWLADLPALARMQLADVGVEAVYGNTGQAQWCTVLQASQFFSYRRDGVCGRMAASIWRI